MTVRNVGMLGLAAERRTFGESVQSLLGMNRLSEAAARTRQFNVPVVWHALQSNGEGSLTEAQVNAQISVLNSAFSQVGARFVLRELRQVEDAGKFACPQSEHDSIAQELAVDPGCAVNVYSCKPASGSLGRARLPGLPESDPRNWVFVRYDTLPGGDSSAFGYGDTLVHEVGHYFGLLHVFEGGECMDSSEDSGDKVVDTPAQSTPSYFTGLGGDACDTPKDTCPDLPGDDSVSNYMDYSGDLCMTEFTPGQELRMVAMIAQHKPSLWAGNCPTTSPQPTPRVNVNFVPRAVRGADAAAAGGASGSQGGGVGNCPPWQPGCGEATTRAAQRGGGAEVRGAAAGGFAYDSGIGGVDLRAAASAEASASFGGFTGAETGSGPSTTPAETIAP
ncbi:unnamed protein product [Pedinophyceae sp. YPF-701]|nr:unnamed protein product [Pedinophyceae sp. YPF-701]